MIFLSTDHYRLVQYNRFLPVSLENKLLTFMLLYNSMDLALSQRWHMSNIMKTMFYVDIL